MKKEYTTATGWQIAAVSYGGSRGGVYISVDNHGGHEIYGEYISDATYHRLTDNGDYPLWQYTLRKAIKRHTAELNEMKTMMVSIRLSLEGVE